MGKMTRSHVSKNDLWSQQFSAFEANQTFTKYVKQNLVLAKYDTNVPEYGAFTEGDRINLSHRIVSENDEHKICIVVFVDKYDNSCLDQITSNHIVLCLDYGHYEIRNKNMSSLKYALGEHSVYKNNITQKACHQKTLYEGTYKVSGQEKCWLPNLVKGNSKVGRWYMKNQFLMEIKYVPARCMSSNLTHDVGELMCLKDIFHEIKIYHMPVAFLWKPEKNGDEDLQAWASLQAVSWLGSHLAVKMLP